MWFFRRWTCSVFLTPSYTCSLPPFCFPYLLFSLFFFTRDEKKRKRKDVKRETKSANKKTSVRWFKKENWSKVPLFLAFKALRILFDKGESYFIRLVDYRWNPVLFLKGKILLSKKNYGKLKKPKKLVSFLFFPFPFGSFRSPFLNWGTGRSSKLKIFLIPNFVKAL